MPTWQPNWTDVQFDYQAAYEAIGNCYGCQVGIWGSFVR